MKTYQRNNQLNKSWNNKPSRGWKPKPPMPPGCNYYAEVRDGDDPMRAYRRIKKKIKDDKFFDILKEKQYYRKPSFKKREKAKRGRITLKKLQRERDDNRFMGRSKRG